MERFNALGRGLQLMLMGGVLLLVDTFLNWQSVTIGAFTFGRNAWHGLGGVLLGLLVIVLLAWLAVQLAAVDVKMPVSATLIAAFLGFLIFIVALLKNLVDDYSSFWSYVGVGLAALIAVGAWMQVQATGGVDALKSDLPSIPSTASGTAAAEAPATSPASAPAAAAPAREAAAPAPETAAQSEPAAAPAEPAASATGETPSEAAPAADSPTEEANEERT